MGKYDDLISMRNKMVNFGAGVAVAVGALASAGPKYSDVVTKVCGTPATVYQPAKRGSEVLGPFTGVTAGPCLLTGLNKRLREPTNAPTP
jgi:hypothetical protein